MNNAKQEASSGAQTVDRACVLLREMARCGRSGARILDLCAATALSRPTVHRILQSLIAAGLVQQFGDNRRYALGSGMFELGMAVPNPIAQFPQVQSVIETLAATTDDTVYLMMRSYDDVLCAWRAQGAYPIAPNVVELGSRRPISASMAGIGLLGALPEDDADLLISANSAYLPKFCRMTEVEVRRLVKDARSQGYSTSVNAVIDGVAAVGMAVPSRYRRPYMAVSVSAIASRIPQERIPVLTALLKRSTDAIAAMTGSASEAL